MSETTAFIYYRPNEGVYYHNRTRGYGNTVNWLCLDLVDEINRNDPTSSDIDSITGNIKKEKFAKVCNMILPVGRRFCNFNQAFQYVNMFVDKWGMVVSQKSGNHIFCYYAHKTTSEKKKKMATLNEKRNRVNVPKQIQCPWFMKFKCSRQSDSKISKKIDTNTNKRISSLNIPVEISEVMYLWG